MRGDESAWSHTTPCVESYHTLRGVDFESGSEASESESLSRTELEGDQINTCSLRKPDRTDRRTDRRTKSPKDEGTAMTEGRTA